MQPDRGLPGSRRALHTEALVGICADDVVLVRLDGRHDVAHRARPRPFNLLDEDAADRRPPAGAVGLAGPGELLVLIGGELIPGEPEPPPPRQAHGVGRAGTVEGPGHWRPPVDDDGVALAVVDVSPADVQLLARQRPPGLGRPAAQAVVARRRRVAGVRREIPGMLNGGARVIKPPKEQWYAGDVAQGLRPAVQVGLEVFLRYRIPRHRAQPQHVLAHQPQELAGAAEVVALGGEHRVGLVAGRRGGVTGPAGRGHASSPRSGMRHKSQQPSKSPRDGHSDFRRPGGGGGHSISAARKERWTFGFGRLEGAVIVRIGPRRER